MDAGPHARFLTYQGAAPRPSSQSETCPAVDTDVTKPGTARILIVEDQDDVRRMLALTLRLEGHEVTEASNATDGLERLKSGQYQMVLSDYAMPGATGSWMLNEAATLGLLDHTAAVIITAHPAIEAVPGIVVLSKPLDLDCFVDQLHRLLDPVADTPSPMVDRSAPHRVDLTLYVSSVSEASRQARAAVEEVLSGFVSSQVRYTVRDLIEEPQAGAEDRIAFTPTLVRRHPAPRVWLLGSLRDPQIVTNLLEACGVDRDQG